MDLYVHFKSFVEIWTFLLETQFYLFVYVLSFSLIVLTLLRSTKTSWPLKSQLLNIRCQQHRCVPYPLTELEVSFILTCQQVDSILNIRISRYSHFYNWSFFYGTPFLFTISLNNRVRSFLYSVLFNVPK